MIKAIIIEDEPFTANRLKRLIEEVQGDVEIVTVLQTVKESLDWLAVNNEPDLYFMDIQLSDGLSFDIFSGFNISKPIIFTTAYDEYAIKAFRVNGIDYLLKPIVKEELEKAFKKFQRYNPQPFLPNLQEILKNIANHQTVYKTNVLVEWRDQLQSIPLTEVAYFWLSQKTTHLVGFKKEAHIVNATLDSLENEVEPTKFFRINRQFLISRASIQQINLYFGNRLKLSLKPASQEEVIVSRDRVPDFKLWLDR
ncbi:LytR/AlgR family response regulator transcription factor [Chitinophaga ginsengisoli]|uniref:LytTR family two component transcriptional regulator n=1 Tax=Chitinophaga ginsengisoli TaxID=363837 RepID=A0A2P8G4W1_9BACT|nr:LytTR family DNA-binding domain-containing protein [Chitinophaga ginsengisoli]PSL29004.1 LytTR family two component transcriptional regulator [Chitinophaga ginsengisoli]